MATASDIPQRLARAVPLVRSWIDLLLLQHQGEAVPVSALGLARLGSYFPGAFLDRARVVMVERVPFPPASQFGLPELAAMERTGLAGITFRDTCFVDRRYASAGLCFHELVHVVQWDVLGVDRFLLAYGVGLLQSGYEHSPLERTAYALQASFERGIPLPGVVDAIREDTERVWRGVEPLLNDGDAVPSGA